MKQEEMWQRKYNEVKRFIETNHRNPSKHKVEDHNMLNWVKYNRRVMNEGEMKEGREEAFKKLLLIIDCNKRKNQYK